jgi:hypothetical protein
MRTLIIVMLVITVMPVMLFSQNTGSVSGTIQNSETKEALPFINVAIENTANGTITDNKGFFKIQNLQAGTYNVIFSSIGFDQRKIENVSVENGQNLDLGLILMAEGAISLDEVVVSPGSYSVMEKVKSVASHSLSKKNIEEMAIAEDITRTVSRLPGISASDYSSKFAIRGGEADEVLISLDGMELYEPFHQRDYSGGLFCIVDIEAVGSVNLMTGGFSAENGNRLSGVYDMRTKSPEEKRKTKIGVSIMNASFYSEGRFGNNKGSYLVSARRGMLDLSLKAIGNNEWFPKFYDGLAKMEYRLTDKMIFSAHILHSGDRALINNAPDDPTAFDRFDSKFYSTYTWFTLKNIYSEKLFSRTIVYGGTLNHNRYGGFDKYEYSDKVNFRVNDKRTYNYAGIKQDWNWRLHKKIHLRFGAEAKELWADYKYSSQISDLRVDSNEVIYSFSRDLDFNMKPSGEQIGTYLNTRVIVLPKLIAELGARYDYTSYTGDKNFSPRAALLYAISKKTSLRAGWGYYYQSQFINNIDVNNGNSEFDPYELAKHYVVGFEHSFDFGVSLRMEGYYKDYSHVSPLWQNLRDHLEDFPEARNDNALIVFNGITSKGIELFLKYDNGKKISWWFSYALAQATDDIKEIEYNGMLEKHIGLVPRLNDQRHTIYADINYRPGKNWHFSASWQFYTGWPRTDYTYRYQEIAPDTLHFYAVHGGFNQTLYPAYHRMDIKINKTFPLKYGKLTTYLLIVNAYNRENLKKFDLDCENDSGQLSLDSDGNYVPFEDNKYWLGFTPVFGISWEF